MKIWFISAYDVPNGHSSRTYDYARELAGRGHKVTLFTSSFDHFSRKERLRRGEKFRQESTDGIDVVWLKTIPYHKSTAMRFLNMLSNAWRAYFVGRSLGHDLPDVIVGPTVPLFTGLAAYGLSRKLRCAFCFEVRDIWPQALIDLGVLSERSPVAWGLKKIEAFLYRNADRIVVVLPFAHRHIAKYGNYAEKIAWVPNGVNFARYAEGKSYDGGKDGLLRVMYVGRFTTAHNVETLVHAAKIANARGYSQKIRFTLIGDGEKKDTLASLIEKLALPNVELCGFVSKREIPALLETADLLIATINDAPIYQYGVNLNKIYDYFGSGRPVVFAGKSPNDPVVDSGAGFSVPPENPDLLADAIASVCEMPPGRRKEMGARGLAYAREHFDTRKLAMKLESVFESAAASHKRGDGRGKAF